MSFVIGNPTVVKGATEQIQPSNQTGTASATAVMMGLAGTITPVVTGRICITVSGDVFNPNIGDGATVQLSYGTGAAPANGAALAGTQVGTAVKYVAATVAAKVPFSVTAVVTGLTLSTAYWIDLAVAATTGGTASVNEVSISAFEV